MREEILKQKEKVDKLDEEYLESLEGYDGFEQTERIIEVYEADRKYIAMLENELDIKEG